MACCAGLPAQADQLVAIKQLEAIRDAYQAAPGNLRSRFQHLFLNVVENPASCVKPDGERSPHVPELFHCLKDRSAGACGGALMTWPHLAFVLRRLMYRQCEMTDRRQSCQEETKKSLALPARRPAHQTLLNPAGVDELQWREAMQRAGGEGNAGNLWPVLALGTKDLLARKHAQVRRRYIIFRPSLAELSTCSLASALNRHMAQLS